jgi:hypothetical protein
MDSPDRTIVTERGQLGRGALLHAGVVQFSATARLRRL